jgi:hypothetical protein
MEGATMMNTYEKTMGLDHGQAKEQFEIDAQRELGADGYAIACLLNAQGKGSKGLVANQIEKAGFDTNKVLAWAKQAYSQEGLLATVGALLDNFKKED